MRMCICHLNSVTRGGGISNLIPMPHMDELMITVLEAKIHHNSDSFDQKLLAIACSGLRPVQDNLYHSLWTLSV